MILVLAGTSEARMLIQHLAQKNIPHQGTVVSEYGAVLLKSVKLKSVKEGEAGIHQGSLDEDGLTAYLKDQGITLVVDATHPYAVQASQTAMAAAKKVGVPYLRWEREQEEIPRHPQIHEVDTLKEAACWFVPGQRVFSTLGSRQVGRLAQLAGEKQAYLLARVLPVRASLEACEAAGLRPEQIIAMKGPFSKALNRAMFADTKAQLVLTKESGEAGGFQEKIEVALELDMEVVVLRRPRLAYPQVLHTLEEVLAYIKKEGKDKI